MVLHPAEGIQLYEAEWYRVSDNSLASLWKGFSAGCRVFIVSGNSFVFSYMDDVLFDLNIIL